MDDIAVLRKATATTDAVGNAVKTYTETQVFCKTRSVTRSEFYDAAQAGLRPAVVLSLSNAADYHGEEEAEWRGKVYGILRAYWTEDGDGIELTLEEKTGLNGMESGQ